MKKIGYFLGVICIMTTPICLAQSPLALNLHNLINSVEVAGTNPLGDSSRVHEENLKMAQEKIATFYGDSYDYNYRNQKMSQMSNSSNPYQYNSQETQKTATIPFFELRRMNGYYRDMETWRREERTRLRREGRYDADEIDRVYRIR